jgi:hypothetical protein
MQTVPIKSLVKYSLLVEDKPFIESTDAPFIAYLGKGLKPSPTETQIFQMIFETLG